MIPVIDIAPLVNLTNYNTNATSADLERVIESIADACQKYGFFAAINHGINTTTIDDAWNESIDFFDNDPAVKQSVSMATDYPYGYENYESLGVERSSAAASVDNNTKAGATTTTCSPDSKETFSLGPLNSDLSKMPARKFPLNSSSNFAPALTSYYNAMEQLAKILFRGLAMALKLDDASWFLQEGLFDEAHQSALRILNYPELEYVQTDATNVIRAGAHTDYGAITILKSGGPGLQLQLSKDKDTPTWIDVPHLENSFVINLGDMMQRWTNDKWKSTLHRVVAKNSDEENTNNRSRSDDGLEQVFKSDRRQSIAFFVNVNGDATVTPLKTCVDERNPARYEPIKASEHLIQRHEQSMMAKHK